MSKSEFGIFSASKRVNFNIIPYVSLYNCNKTNVINMILIELNHSSSNYAWLLIAFDFILGLFSVHLTVACQIFNLSLNFSQISLNLV